MKLRLFKFWFIGLLSLAGCLVMTGSAAADGWVQAAFNGAAVSVVSVNPYQQDEVAAVVNGQTKLTLDGGLLWRDTNLPGVANRFVFDSVHQGDIYAGTQHGVYRSTDLGLNWQLVGNPASGVLNVTAMTENSAAIFTTETIGSGSVTQVFRINRDGQTTSLAFPSSSPTALTADSDGSIYAGTREGIYKSRDNGSTWQFIAGLGQVGSFTSQLTSHGGQLWQTSVDGVFISPDLGVTWSNQANYRNLPDLYPNFNARIQGLAINKSNAFVGIHSPFYNINDVYELRGDTRTNLNFSQVPNDLAAGDGTLWVASDNGLWRQGGVVGSEAQIRRPVVIVPGILGSWQLPSGKWALDPITHAYDPLMSALEADGYTEGQTLFAFPYQWRQDNRTSAQQLADKLIDIRRICSCNKVDIIGHSMGGLVARAYIESENYKGDVENLIELGTPNAGSVEDYSIWEAGVSVDQDWVTVLELKLFNLEAYENHFLTITSYVRNNVPSVGQLLPVYNYLADRVYPNGYPRNQFLEELNQDSQVNLLKSKVHLFVVGSNTMRTLTSLIADPHTTNEKNWPDGQIIEKNYGLGDGTVPFLSLTSISQANLVLGETHGDLAKHPNPMWFRYLFGDQVSTSFAKNQINKLLMIYVKSPVRLSVIDPVGHQINDQFNQVNGAFYTGSDSQVQFITIPNPLPGQYRIDLFGKSSGSYTVGVTTISNDPTLDSQVEQTGLTTAAQQTAYTYQSDLNKLDPIAKDAATPVDSSYSQLFAPTKALNPLAQIEVSPSVVIADLPSTELISESLTSNTIADSLPATQFHDGSIIVPSKTQGQKAFWYLAIVTLMVSGIIAVILWLLRKQK